MLIEQTSGMYVGDILNIILMLTLVVLIPGYIISRKKGVPYRRFVYLFTTLLYCGIILFITIFRRAAGSKSGQIVTFLQLGSVNGSRLSLRQSIYSLLNVFLFIPWGYLLYLGNGDKNTVKRLFITTLLGFLSSFCIECVQLTTKRGVFEVTDMITNTTGTLIGALICMMVLALVKRFLRNESKEEQK